MGAEHVRVERKGGITTVILDRPHARNAVDRPTADALVQAFLAFEHDNNQKVAVLWGAGGNFSAGADLKGISEGRGNRIIMPGQHYDPHAGDAPMGPTRMRLLKPVIAAVAGHAVAGGLELACWADLRVAEEDAVFGVYCRRWGVPLIDGGTVRLPRLIGQSRAMDMILTGRGVGAEEAYTWGLANRVVPKGDSRRVAEDMALEISRFPEICMKGDRQSVHEQWDMPHHKAMINEFKIGTATLQTGESRAGASRFASGRGRGGRFDDL
ncbi:MAG: crotonase/enoyl-CoA hydratase family protein [Alphaproteobacteria bacterium]|nr:crotonase/enoyl-CoA hydratase family protein [Alphaproteobacteria bacterium]MBL7097477.1 crotonase/enoyl-CoA hydratase family protein [Alphaproteobacteria bacterium]